MKGRRTFLAGLAAALLPVERALAGPFRRRRCVPSKMVPQKAGKEALSKAGKDLPKPTTGDSFIQPDYKKWSQVKVGMTEAEVLDLLGKPLEGDTEESVIAEIREEEGGIAEAEAVKIFRLEFPNRVFKWLYGRLRYDSPAIPDDYEFYLYFQKAVVSDIYTPFRGPLSPDGKPTAPALLWPDQKASFSHFPRFVDLRWFPSSGEYPMTYEMEYTLGQYEGMKYVYVPWKLVQSDIPHAAIQVAGKNHGRWRVRARNRLGESNWSEYRHLTFEI